MVRLVDVARRAGVSLGTASNVFNNPDVVRPALRERVVAAAQDLGYGGPDPKGRLLRDGRYNAIAVMTMKGWGLADSFRNPVYMQFFQGVAEICDAEGAGLVFLSGKAGQAGASDALVDGIIFAGIEQIADVAQARQRRLPFVVVDSDPGPGINAALVDSRAGARLAAAHLLALGHRRFGIMAALREQGAAQVHPAGAVRPVESAGMVMDQQKYQGYAAALAAAGIAIGTVPMVQATVDDPVAAGLLLDLVPDATAILSMTVMQALSLCREATRRGISVPGDLSVVGYNDFPEAARSQPPLTTIDAFGTEKGRRAARILFEPGPARHEVLEPRLVIRGSTASPPG